MPNIANVVVCFHRLFGTESAADSSRVRLVSNSSNIRQFHFIWTLLVGASKRLDIRGVSIARVRRHLAGRTVIPVIWLSLVLIVECFRHTWPVVCHLGDPFSLGNAFLELYLANLFQKLSLSGRHCRSALTGSIGLELALPPATKPQRLSPNGIGIGYYLLALIIWSPLALNLDGCRKVESMRRRLRTLEATLPIIHLSERMKG